MSFRKMFNTIKFNTIEPVQNTVSLAQEAQFGAADAKEQKDNFDANKRYQDNLDAECRRKENAMIQASLANYKACIEKSFTDHSAHVSFHRDNLFQTKDCDRDFKEGMERSQRHLGFYFIDNPDKKGKEYNKGIEKGLESRAAQIYQQCMSGKPPFDVDARSRGGREAMCEKAKNSRHSI